jgi:DNA-binding transcriptional MocR family regulator
VPLERKREVYDICCRHGLLLLEDDAYQYLQFPLGPTQPPGLSGLPHRSSYLSLDTDGRVIR